MLVGASKIWYLVPKCHFLLFREFRKENEILDMVCNKRCYMKAFDLGGVL
jgi:hypothetical protein